MSLNKISNNKINLSFLVIIALFAIGLGFQSFFPPFNIQILKYPLNLIISILLISISLIICLLASRNKITRFLSSGIVAISAIIFILILSIVLGLTHQTNNVGNNDVPFRLGIRQMTSYYPFIISYLYLIITLSFVTVKRIKKEFSVKNIAFFVNHGGLLILLLTMGFGAADHLELRINIAEGNSTNLATDRNGKIHHLPFSIELKDFNMEIYMPKMGIIDNETGRFLPQNTPAFWDIDSTHQKIKLLSYDFLIEEYISHAKPQGKIYIPDNETYPPAIKLNFNGVSAWITCGNNKVPFSVMSLNDDNTIVMLEPETKSFSSDLIIIKNNEFNGQKIQVNKPLKVDNWTIYQSSFDKEAGANSNISGLQLIYDPWQNLTLFGMLMLAIGAICLFWKL